MIKTLFRLAAVVGLSCGATTFANELTPSHHHRGPSGLAQVAQKAGSTAQAARQVAWLAQGQNPRYAQAARAAAQSCRQAQRTASLAGRGPDLAAALRNCQDGVAQVQGLFNRFGNRIHDYRIVRASRELFLEARALERATDRMRRGGGHGGRHGGRGW